MVQCCLGDLARFVHTSSTYRFQNRGCTREVDTARCWSWKTWSNGLCPPLSCSLSFGNDMSMIYVPQVSLALYKPCKITYVNNIEPSIQFTVERETNQEIAFLDVSVYQQDNSQLANKVYRKPTHTERYLALESHHPIAHKKAVVKSLTNRVRNIPTTSHFRSKQLKQVTSALLANGYLKRFIIDSSIPKWSPQQSVAAAPKDVKSFCVLP